MRNSRQFVPTQDRNKRARIAVVIFVVALIIIVPVTRNVIRGGARFVGMGIVRASNSVGGWFSSVGTAFRSKNALEKENENLKSQLSDINEKLLADDSLRAENENLKSAMGRTTTEHFILSAVLAKPPRSIYDTLLVDGGEKAGMSIGQSVYANGEIPIGKIESVQSSSALVRLFSSPKVSTLSTLDIPNATGISHIDITLVGHGGGNFQTSVPRDLVIPSDAKVFSKGINPHMMAVFQKVTSDARDPFQALLLTTPVNIQELNFVEIGQSLL
jgi:cell shape-determining protein MreC